MATPVEGLVDSVADALARVGAFVALGLVVVLVVVSVRHRHQIRRLEDLARDAGLMSEPVTERRGEWLRSRPPRDDIGAGHSGR